LWNFSVVNVFADDDLKPAIMNSIRTTESMIPATVLTMSTDDIWSNSSSADTSFYVCGETNTTFKVCETSVLSDCIMFDDVDKAQVVPSCIPQTVVDMSGVAVAEAGEILGTFRVKSTRPSHLYFPVIFAMCLSIIFSITANFYEDIPEIYRVMLF